MPIGPDISIYGSLNRPVEEMSPLKTLGAMMQIKEQQALMQQRQLEAQQKAQQIKDDQAKRAMLQIYSTPEEAARAMIANGISGGFDLLNQVHTERTNQYQETDASLKALQSHANWMTQQLGALGPGADDAKYQPVKTVIANTLGPQYPQLVEQLPTTYDEGAIDDLRKRGMSVAEQLQNQRDAMAMFEKARTQDHNDYTAGLMTGSEVRRREAARNPKAVAVGAEAGPDYSALPENSKSAMETRALYQESIGRMLLATHTKDQADKVLNDAANANAPKDIVQAYRDIPYDPQYNQAVTRMALTVQQRTGDETAAAKAASDRDKALAETAAANQRVGIAEAAQRLAEQRAEFERTKWQASQDNPKPGTPGGPEKPLTPVQKNAEERRLKKEDKDTETWVSSQPQETGTKAGQSGYELLSPDAKQEYVRRKVETQDNRRVRVQGLPKMVDAATAAVNNHDRAAYDKLAKEYHDITNGAGQLEDEVPWDDAGGTGATTTPSATPPLSETLTPAQRQALEARRRAMRGGR